MAEIFTASEIAAISGGAIVGDPRARMSLAVADSREASPGCLFVALPGAKADGHDFIGKAIEGGATCVLARSDRRDRIEADLGTTAVASGLALIFVPDVLAALHLLAREHRSRFPALLRVGITGSSGKTTTKECAAAVLGRDRALVLNPGNLNSDIGLPLSLFALRSEHQIAVFEMGMNRKGEMAELAAVFEPDIALITNVGTAHIGMIGSRDNIAKEKKSVFSRFDGRQTGFVWEDDPYNAFLKDSVRGEVRDFGPRSTKGFRGARDLGLEGYEIDWEGIAFGFALPGRHNLLNAIAVMALADRIGVSPANLAEGLSSVRPLFGRSEILKGEHTVIRDCYNANPDSVEAAIGLCDGLEWKGRRVYVLGAMLELGEESAAAHARMGSVAGESRAEALFFFGEEAKPSFESARGAGFKGILRYETDFERLRGAVSAYLRPGDLVLVKASRGLELERLVDAIAGAGSPAGESRHAP
jgi:UDP-N-acetylmuramoyl-tripeptide--D-alanyl-D-alanine ligase